MRILSTVVVQAAVLIACIQTLFAQAAPPQKPVDLLIVAGQSNAVGYDAKPGELPADEADKQILFWWKCGDPPPDEHDSTSGGMWTHLQAQPLGNPKKPKANRQYGNFAQKEGGFGPEIGLARTLYDREKKPLAVVKAAFSGTGLRRDWDHTDSGEGGACYRALVTEVKAAIEAAKQNGMELRPRVFTWVQGESDANANDSSVYARNLTAMIAALRTDLNAPQLTVLVAVNTKFGGGKNPFMPKIVEQQQLAGSFDPRCEYVDTSAASIANNVHYDAKGTLEVGRLFAESLLTLEKKLQPEKRHLTIVTLGDSITKGVRSGVTDEQTFAALAGKRLTDEGYSVRVINVGIGGERTDQALARLESVFAHKPDIVTIMYGTNDSYVDKGKTASRLTVDQYRANLQNIVAQLLRRGIQPVLMTEPRWSDKAGPNGLGENPNVKLEPFIEACRETASKWRVPLVDHFADWTNAKQNGADLHGWTTDGCHPNADGHAKLADAMLPILKQAIGPELKTRTKLLSGEPVRVVCFGDSVTGVYYHTGSRRAYTDMLGIALNRASGASNVEMVNAGISGHTTVNGLARIDLDVLAHKPDLVTVMFGLNDMTRVSLDDYRANLKTIVEKCRAIGAEVVLATPNNVVTSGGRSTEKLITYCDVVLEVGREVGAPVCDSYSQLDAARTNDEVDWRLLMSDAIHPNMDGHKRMAEQLARTITGLHVSLGNVTPLRPAIPQTLARLKAGQPIRVLAMPPFDSLIEPALKKFSRAAKVEVTSWPTGDLTLAKIEEDAKVKVRAMKPDLVLLAVPRTATSDSDEAFAGSYGWVMNWSLNFGPPTWDCVVIHPSVFETTTDVQPRDELVRRLVRAQDLDLIDRPTGSSSNPETILQDWLAKQFGSEVAEQAH